MLGVSNIEHMDRTPLDMTSKRSSRVFVDDESTSSQEKQQKINTPFRSSSRNSAKEDNMQAKETEDGLTNGVSIRDAINIARPQSVSAISVKSSVSTVSSESSVSSVSTYQSQNTEHPLAPLNGRPHNFGVVVPGVYRSSFPKSHDFEYIKGLKLKTIVSLVKKEEFDHDLEMFVAQEGIRQVVFNMKGTKKEAIPLKTMKSILSIVLNKENYPLLIHCNHGKHRTGCVVGVVRKVAGWDVESVVAEYKSYAEPKSRECDIEYLSSFQTSTLCASNNLGPKYTRSQMTTFFRTLTFSTFVLLLWLLSGTKLSTAASRPDHLLL
ncbi:Hypothetical protein NCS54_00020200 [Fusarium falciforme]|uniref:Tyrosine-protein phosphatase siw14 n=1 Tax=Fusarium falciforme TaxID=195108 RepID=A0A9W8R6H3_9HYPO|nr:Hypothetical protein NCS54_00020200 [Fusarium falciforme]KAJ4186245.1 tyrosine-protein phosphatase siw14 [Fusarium falciforme]KAJ4254282.1 tyrosine-protein phosphatase siw14 [Fusarium falciforme]WAO83022.1 Hypothetical protein NCS54_00020200 [Fusarium falciforme]